VYAALAALPALRPVPAGARPPAPLPADALAVPTFRSAVSALGAAGMAVIGLTALGAIFTNLVGNTMVSSRLVSSMAAEGVFPAALAATGPDGAPRRAVLAIAGVSLFVPLLGRTAIGFIVDVTTVGAAIAYVYVSAAALRTARSLPPGPARRRDEIAGSLGAALSLAIAALFLLPNLFGGGSLMATESYFILAIWCVAGIIAFLAVCRRDREHRFGRSPIVWLGLLALVLFLSVTWMRQSTFEATEEVFGDIEGRPAAGAVFETLEEGKTRLERSILRHSLVQTGTTVLSFVLLLGLYAVLRRRELDMEAEKARAKSYFFSTVSHDIRTPLNAIIGYSEMLRQGIRDADEREKALDSIVVSGRTLLGLVNDVLDLSKLESGKMEIEPEPTDCPRLLGELADAFRATIANPALELRCRPGAMPLLMLDPQRLRQVVFNLVGNAVKFTERGHVEIRAAWEPGADGAAGTFRLDVEDTGCGIGKKDLARIASAYVQVGSKTGRNGGTGLGLAICKQLAAAMGGRLEVVSEPGRGSTFSLVVPGVRAAGEAEKAACRGRLGRAQEELDRCKTVRAELGRKAESLTGEIERIREAAAAAADKVHKA
ncbi:MAG: amino acid permease, partial [Kiritimatiellae bacterium]|nr:amino acid permease [Kiritimatiellia bacterium]